MFVPHKAMNTRRYTKYPLLRVTIVLICGMMVGHAVPSEQWWLVGLCALLVLAFCLQRRCVGQSIALTVAWFALGGYLMSHSVVQMNVTLPNEDVEYDAVLTSEPMKHGKVLMADALIVDGDAPMKVRISILCDTLGRWRVLQVGSGLRARSLLVQPTNYRGGTFDYAAYLREHGIRACTFIYKDNWREEAVDLSNLSSVDRTVLQAKRLRHRLLKRIGKLGAEGQDYAVLAALTLGEKSYLSRDIKDDYSVSGASHVLALSGLHLGIVYALLSFLMMGWRRRWAAQFLIVTLIWAYVVLVGFSPSVVRSALMLTAYALVSFLQRDRFSLNTLAFAALIMLLANPLTIYDMGFQFSFLSVLGILLFTPLLETLVQRSWLQRHRVLAWAWGMIEVSLAAQLAVSPMVAYHFGRFSCYFLLSNFVAVPCATVLLYGAVMLVPLSFVPMLNGWWVDGLMFVVKMMNGSLQWIASLPGASLENISWNAWQVVTVYVLLVCGYLLWCFLLKHGIIERPSEPLLRRREEYEMPDQYPKLQEEENK